MRRLLLIDDEEGIRIMWKKLHDTAQPVFRGQLEMEIASNLEQGIERIEEAKAKGDPFDVVITDLKFQGLGSDATVSWLAENQGKLPPIIVMTGDEDIWVRRRCMMFGANDFWLKLDAVDRPDLFFKSLYNRYLANYPDKETIKPLPV